VGVAESRQGWEDEGVRESNEVVESWLLSAYGSSNVKKKCYSLRACFEAGETNILSEGDGRSDHAIAIHGIACYIRYSRTGVPARVPKTHAPTMYRLPER
jgi:hypothetical protein